MGGIRKMVYVTAVVRHLFPCIDFSPGNRTGMMEIKTHSELFRR